MTKYAQPLRLPRADAIPLWEMVFAVIGLFLCLDAGVRTVRILSGAEGPIQYVTGQADYTEGSALTQILLFAVYLVSIMLMALHPPRHLMRAFRPALLWLIPALAVVSVAWSGAPTISFRRAVALVGSSVFGLYLATRYSRTQLLRLLLAVSVIAGVLSLGLGVALPAYAIDRAGDWQGVFGQKNQMGHFMALAAVLWFVHIISFRGQRLLVGFGALSVLLVLLSRSATAVVLLVILLAVLALIRLWRLHSGIALPLLAMIATLAGYVAVSIARDPGGLTRLLGKDATLTGRTQLWSLVWQLIASHRWLGFGYGGFWLGLQGPSAPVWRAVGWQPPNAHNGYLDLLLDLGVVGALLFVPVLLGALRHAAALARRGGTLDAAFPLIFLVFLLVSNLTESYLVAYNTLSWVLFVALTTQLYTWRRRERRPLDRGAVDAPAAHRLAYSAARPALAGAGTEPHTAQGRYLMGSQVTVSAIMPTYNAMPYLKEAVDSVLAQTFTDWELIVVDDGSTDGTQALLAQYDDPRIRVFQLDDNHGRGGARNVALGFACGKYIAPCDADDISLPERFATEVAYLESHPEIHIVCTQMLEMQGDAPPRPRILYPEDPEAINRRFARGRMAISFGTAMIRSWCFDRFGPFCEDLRTAEDLEWCLRVRESCNFRVLPDYLYLYRYNPAGQSLFKRWMRNAPSDRYAVYRGRMFGKSGGAVLSFDQFSRRCGTRLALYTWDILRFIAYVLRSTLAHQRRQLR